MGASTARRRAESPTWTAPRSTRHAECSFWGNLLWYYEQGGWTVTAASITDISVLMRRWVQHGVRKGAEEDAAVEPNPARKRPIPARTARRGSVERELEVMRAR